MTKPRQKNKPEVIIYTSGALGKNRNGWGAILWYQTPRKKQVHTKVLSGTTRDCPFLVAAINAVGALRSPCKVEIHSQGLTSDLESSPLRHRWEIASQGHQVTVFSGIHHLEWEAGKVAHKALEQSQEEEQAFYLITPPSLMGSLSKD